MTDIDLADPVAVVRIIEAGARRLIRVGRMLPLPIRGP